MAPAKALRGGIVLELVNKAERKKLKNEQPKGRGRDAGYPRTGPGGRNYRTGLLP